MPNITVTALRGKWPGHDRWMSDGGSRGAGRLVARITRNGVDLYFQYFHGRKRFLPIGGYDESGRSGLTLLAARDKAGELAVLYRSGVTDLHGHIERQRKEEEGARRLAEEAARREREAAQRGTLRALLTTYIEHLEAQGRVSAPGARGALTRHVLEAEPALAALKATEVPADEFVRLLGKLAGSGKGRTAAILRAFLRAAYSLAIRSRTDPSAPLAMRAFGITANPLADIPALSQYNLARNRVLTGPELGAYVKRLEALPDGAVKDSLRLLLLLGGQRPAQLLRVGAADVDLSAATVTLYDPKGARRQPRPHVLPLVRDARAILARRMKAQKDGEPLLSTDGATHLRPETMSNEVAAIAKAMLESKEAAEHFQLRDVRRTAETMLAGLGVSSDVRAQLQSHGLGGIQQRHYDWHDYMAEKRKALTKWVRHLGALKKGKAKRAKQLRKPKHI